MGIQFLLTLNVMRLKRPFQGIRSSFIQMRNLLQRLPQITLLSASPDDLTDETKHLRPVLVLDSFHMRCVWDLVIFGGEYLWLFNILLQTFQTPISIFLKTLEQQI